MMSAKMATPGLLKLKVFWNKGILKFWNNLWPWRHQKNLSSDSNYIVDVVMWSKFGNSSIGIR